MTQAQRGFPGAFVDSPARAPERVESYIIEFTEQEDVDRVRQLYADTGDMDAVMRLAIQIKYRNRKTV